MVNRRYRNFILIFHFDGWQIFAVVSGMDCVYGLHISAAGETSRDCGPKITFNKER